ncbi:MAG: DoxX family protein [Flavobacteriales bacterium]|nr:DoxX family protein [Flavobacteriales bacterium]
MDTSLTVMAGLYIVAGLNHFVMPKFYMRIMPRYIPFHRFMVISSGIAEIGLGILLLVPAYRSWAAWGIIALLIAIFPANIHHLTSRKPGSGPPVWALWLRLPIQGLLVWWAYSYV